MSISKQEFTDAGKSMLGRAQNAERLTISKIVVGSGSAAQPSDLWPLTALRVFEMNVAISTKNDYGDGTLLVEGSLRSDQAPHAFDLREVGVMAHVGTEADRLYSVANCFAEPPNHVDPASPTIEVFKIKLIVDRVPTANVAVSISPSENVVGENIGADTVGPGVYHDALGNVLHFKRLVQGANMDIHNSTDGNSIYIGMNLLPNNVDLYVPMSYVGAPPGALYFPTIQAAHDYLLTFTIPPDKAATIHLDAGEFTGAGNSPVYFYHPNASQIRLIGRPRVDKTITAGPNYIPSPAGYKNITVSGSIADLFVGQAVYLVGVDPAWAGGCFIYAIAGAVITLTTHRKDTQPIYATNNSGTLGPGRLSYYPSVIYEPNPAGNGQPWTASTSNVVCGNNMYVENLCIIGGYHVISMPGTRSACKGLLCFGTGGTGATGVAGGDNVVAVSGSDIVVTDCGFGLGGNFTAHNDNINIAANGCICGISATGVFGAVPGVVTATGKVYLVHNQEAARNWGVITSLGNVYFVLNDLGFLAQNLGCFVFGNVGGNHCNTNTHDHNGLDLMASAMGYINYSKGGGPVPTCSPVAGDPGGNQNSYISVS